MAISISFVCRPYRKNKDGFSPIECSIIEKGNRVVFPLSLKVKPEDFKKDANAKKFCTSVLNTINGYIANLTINGIPPTPQKLKEIYLLGGINNSYTLKNLFDDFKSQKIAEDVAPHTWNKYINAFNEFLNHTSHKYSDEVSTITNADILQFEANIRQNKADTTCCKMLKNVKAFLAFAVAKGKIPFNPFEAKKIGHGKNQNKTNWLTYEEISKIAKLKLDTRLEKIRDCFIFQCFTGLNYSDLTILKEGDVKRNNKGQFYIKKNRYKTGKFGSEHEYTTILFEDAIWVYEKYGEKMPLISYDKYNKYLKEIIEITEIDKKITTKCARKSFACYLFNTLKITDPAVIQKMMGHENIKQTQEYISVFNDTIFETTEKAVSEKFRKDMNEILFGND